MSRYEQNKKHAEKYLSNLDRTTVRTRKGIKDGWQAAAAAAGVSLQRFIVDAVNAAAGIEEDQKAGK